ncbi:hypothetical protein HY086_04615 [Candidatus Gottesmanbacteria bacterium]|nr:hypothetical protein [Candidatus Gottesmanbacteria bacterium]
MATTEKPPVAIIRIIVGVSIAPKEYSSEHTYTTTTNAMTMTSIFTRGNFISFSFLDLE